MADYVGFFLDSSPAVYRIDTLEISHPDFTQTYWVQSAVPDGVTLELEDAGGPQVFQYVPLEITPSAGANDLDAGLTVAFGDLGEILPREIDAIMEADALDVKPTVKFRVYRSDDLTAPMYGPDTFELSALNFTQDGATFEINARTLNMNRTGERYTVTRFPMLAGFLS